MAVTTEPPWLNQSSGIAPRNGTTSHTISFGWTSTSGSLLVFVIFGAVTHTDPSGTWTEQLQPVNSGELSVFTKASAGESSITITHNGSGYPAPWVAYEFKTGSTYTGGIGNSPNADTFPALGSLPGTEQVIIAARGRTSISPGNTSMSSAWSAPWVQDAELLDAYVGTSDGAGLNIAHQINFTGTSITPSVTTTYGGTGWTTPDREHVVVAINAAATSSGVAASAVVSGAPIARASVAKVVSAAARCVGVATAGVAARKVRAATARGTAAGVTSSTAKHVATSSARTAGLATVVSTAAKKTPSAGIATGAAIASATATSGSARPAVARCSGAAVVTGAATRITIATGRTVATATTRAASIHRTPVAATARACGAARAVTAKRVGTTARVVAAPTASGVGGQLGSTRPATGRCVGVAIAYSRFRRVTTRPNAGTTTRPNGGLTARPFAGITYRP